MGGGGLTSYSKWGGGGWGAENTYFLITLFFSPCLSFSAGPKCNNGYCCITFIVYNHFNFTSILISVLEIDNRSVITKFENTFLFAAFCNDSLECERYTTENCDNDWMKSNCKKKCGNCEGMLKLWIRTRLWNSESCTER